MPNYLRHSKGPWKEHKYVRKEGSGKDAKYYYGAGSSSSSPLSETALRSAFGKTLNDKEWGETKKRMEAYKQREGMSDEEFDKFLKNVISVVRARQRAGILEYKLPFDEVDNAVKREERLKQQSRDARTFEADNRQRNLNKQQSRDARTFEAGNHQQSSSKQQSRDARTFEADNRQRNLNKQQSRDARTFERNNNILNEHKKKSARSLAQEESRKSRTTESDNRTRAANQAQSRLSRRSEISDEQKRINRWRRGQRNYAK